MESSTASIYQSIAHQIEQMILEGSLKPQQKIPSERQLCARLGVSRSAVREALRELQGRGLIETRHGKGSFVAEIVAEPEEESPMMQLFFGHNRTLYDLYEVREQLEGQAAFLAAQRGNEKDFYQITKAYNQLGHANKSNRAYLDHAFHQAIVDASHNPVLIHLLNSLKKVILHSVQASVSNLNHRQKLKQQIDKHHQQIYHAVINRQAIRAQKAAAAHVHYVSKQLQVIEAKEQNIIRDAVINPDVN